MSDAGVESTEKDVKEAQRLAEELVRKLPKDFVVKSRIRINGKRIFADIHLQADPAIPGRFRGRLSAEKT
jgi:hypothetical protein